MTCGRGFDSRRLHHYPHPTACRDIPVPPVPSNDRSRPKAVIRSFRYLSEYSTVSRVPQDMNTTGETGRTGSSLREETRFLGRVLGQVLREQIGIDSYERIERIRQESVGFRRAKGAEAQSVRTSPVTNLHALTHDQTLD